MNKVILSGGTGFLGSQLVDRLLSEKYEITILSRNPNKKHNFPSQIKMVKWDYNEPQKWSEELNRNEIIIHLAGANIFGRRWNKNYKKLIVESREKSTFNIINSISDKSSVKLFISASGSGYYGDTDDKPVDETGGVGNDFLSEVCRRWESPSYEADKIGIRRVNLRTSPVLSTKEGYLSKLIIPFRFFIGGPLGKKKSWVSWVHIDDLVNAYIFVIKNNIYGPVNVSSPNPVRMEELASSLGEVMHRPSIFTVPEIVLKMVVGQGAKYISYSQKVLPSVLLKNGFQFRYPELKTALKDILSNKK